MDDEPLLAYDLGSILEAAGASAIATTSCQSAIDALARTRFSAAVLDRMHGDDCKELLLRLSERRIPYLVYSGHRASEGTRTPHVNKPALPTQLVAAVVGLLTFEPVSTIH